MYLLDINILLAFRYVSHVHHMRARRWISDAKSLETEPFATCSIVELGFIRLASGGAGFAANLNVAREDLRGTKSDLNPMFLTDDLDGNQLPNWVTQSKQTTDGHLLELATRHQMRLATLDTRIRDAFVIPEYDEPESMVREPTPTYGATNWRGSSPQEADGPLRSHWCNWPAAA